MHTFSAKITDKKIEMFIPDDILKGAKRVFKHLKKTKVAGAYEVAESGENVAKVVQLEAMLFAKKNRTGLTKDSMGKFFEQLTQKGMFVSPNVARQKMPKVSPVLTTIAKAAAIAPALAEAISFVDEAMKQDDHEVGAICIPPGAIPSSLIADGGPVILLRFHKSFVGLLEEYSCMLPEPSHFRTLDLKETPAANTWQVDRHDKCSVVFGVDIGLFEQLYTEEYVNGQRLERARVIMCAGDLIAFGGHYRDEAIAAKALSFLIDFGQQPNYSEFEIQSAKDALAEHGRTPWLGNFFKGKTKACALIPVCRAEEVLFAPRSTVH